MKIRNWENYQGYEKRGPRWLKLHVALINDPAWIGLPVAARALLPVLWIVASTQGTEGTLPDEPALLSILAHVTPEEVSQGLPALVAAGFIQREKTVARPATEVSGEKSRERVETERENNSAVPVPPSRPVEGEFEGEPAPGEVGSRAGNGVSPERSLPGPDAGATSEAQHPPGASPSTVLGSVDARPALAIPAVQSDSPPRPLSAEERQEYADAVWDAWCLRRGGGKRGERLVISSAEFGVIDWCFAKGTRPTVPLRIVLGAITDLGGDPRGKPLTYARDAIQRAAAKWARRTM